MTLLLAAALLSLHAAPAASTPPADLDRAATVLTRREARERGIGAWVPSVVCRDLDGAAADWRDAAGERGTVLALTSVTCPVGQKLFPALARAEAVADRLGFGFVHVGVQGLDDAAALRAHAERHGLEGLVLQDIDGGLARALDARTTTEVFVVDARGTLRYRGALNDQYGIGFALPAAREHFLRDALVALATAKELEVPATSAPGCVVEHEVETVGGASDVTYARDVSRLMQRSCVECHRDGGVAPFPLDSYPAVSRRASMLLSVVDEGLMPPWFAAEHEGESPWANDRSLLPGERDLLARWIEAGKPEGDAAEQPLPRRFETGGWVLGEPDAIYAMPRSFNVPAEGRVNYKYFAVPTNLERDAWIEAIEVRPGAVDVVHHVLAHALPAEAFKDGRLVRWDLLDERRGFFAAWAPGAEPVVYPDGHARLLEAGTVLMFELHYTPNGTARRDRSAVGVHFASTDPAWRPERIVRTAGISNRSFEVPARASAHVDTATGLVKRAMRITSLMPHMHLRGKAFRFDRVALDGARTTLLDVPRYDFNWQLAYNLEEPIVLEAGERLDVRAVFDNSSANLANPAPDRPVRWGPDTDDEMLIGFVDYVLVEEDQDLSAEEPQFAVIEPRVRRYLVKLARENGGTVPRSALKRRMRRSFDRLDLDGDGELDARELTSLGVLR